jgi:hypothetical protein
MTAQVIDLIQSCRQASQGDWPGQTLRVAPASRSFTAEDVPALLEIFEHRLVRTEGDEMKTETIGLSMGQRSGLAEPEEQKGTLWPTFAGTK